MRIAIEKVGVPTDFSKPAEHAVMYGVALAEQFQAELHLIHVVEDIVNMVPEAGLAFSAVDLSESLTKQAEEWLKALPGPNAAPNLHVVRTVKFGEPFREIHRYAQAADLDLLVVGTHGRTGFVHWLMGSTAERVVRSAPCPVLTVRHPEHEFVFPDDTAATKA